MATANGKTIYRLNIPVPEDTIDFLHKIALKTKSCGGKKLYKTTLIRGFIDAIRELDDSGLLDFTGVKDVESLKHCIVDSFRKIR